MSRSRAENKRLKCECGGYWFPHRIGSGACTHSKRADFYTAIRCGVPFAEAQQLLSAIELDRMFPYEDRSELVLEEIKF